MRRYITFLTVAVSLMLQACAVKVDPEDSCHFEQNSLKQRVSWESSVPVRLHIHKSVPPEFHGEIRAAINEWNDEFRRDLFVIAGDSSEASSKSQRDGESTIFWLDTWDGSKTTEQARTTSYWRNNKIYESDIRINNRDFDYYVNDKDKGLFSSPVHFRSLMIHELGHVLGLAHREAVGSVMSSTLSVGEERAEVTEVDLTSLECEY